MKAEGQDHLSRAEISKDAFQAGAEAAIGAVAEVATIVTGAVKDVAGALGGLATEIFEIRDASKRAMAEHADPAALDVDDLDVVDLDDEDLDDVDLDDDGGLDNGVDPVDPV